MTTTKPSTNNVSFFVSAQLAASLSLVPGYMRRSVEDYVLFGKPVSAFLYALFTGMGLVKVFRRADYDNEQCLNAWANVLYNGMPSASYGSPEKVRAWIKHSGLSGLNANDKEKRE